MAIILVMILIDIILPYPDCGLHEASRRSGQEELPPWSLQKLAEGRRLLGLLLPLSRDSGSDPELGCCQGA